ncbi:unnamed protein product [Mytilus coruscus]|uniref:C-type lectin domain-containing protein n=1 Tax=Mytilus coruscus TaxID=42192 RepID=A0A6J8CFM4_MYTCO|nr:unnamed protein product [Mytilus coruscus]
MLTVLISLLFGPIHVAGIACNYSVLVGNFDWETGRQQCIDTGMDFASITDSTIQSEVETFLIENNPGSDVWLGLKWNVSKQTFYWVNNVSLNTSTWRNWAPDEPNCMDTICMDANTNYQDCVRMANGEWKTFYCNSAFVALCQSCLSTTNFSSTITVEPTRNMLETSTPVSYLIDTRNKLSTNGRTETTAQGVLGTTEVFTGTSKNRRRDYLTTETSQHTNSPKTKNSTMKTSTTDNCKSKQNACQCRKTMSNTTESVKMSDYIWLRKCEVQPLIVSGVLNELDCPYSCYCYPRATNDTDSEINVYDMFACIKRR